MSWLARLLGWKRRAQPPSSESELVPLPTGDTKIFANVMVRAQTQNEIDELLQGFEILQAHAGLPSEALRAASIVEETYPFVKQARNIDPLSTGWLENISNILKAINDNAEKYIEAQDKLEDAVREIERRRAEET